MSTPRELFARYVKEICPTCDKVGDCDIRITNYNGVITAKCKEFNQIDYCMKHKCNTCKNYKKCFGGGNNGKQ